MRRGVMLLFFAAAGASLSPFEFVSRAETARHRNPLPWYFTVRGAPDCLEKIEKEAPMTGWKVLQSFVQSLPQLTVLLAPDSLTLEQALPFYNRLRGDRCVKLETLITP